MENDVFKALSHPLRRQVLAVLRAGPRGAGELAGMFEATWPTVSRHLSVLKDADLISAKRVGSGIIYSANLSVMEDVLALLIDLINPNNGEGSKVAKAERSGS